MTDAQPLSPTDAEIFVVAREAGLLPDNSHPAPETRAARKHSHAVQAFARAVLAKWGTPPAVAGEPVAWLDPWTGTKVTTDYDAYGKHGIPLYTAPQPAQAQAGAVPMSHEAAKALVRKYGNDPLHLVLQVERHHGIKGGQHGTE